MRPQRARAGARWAAATTRRRSPLLAVAVGGVALLIDAKSERAAAWYRGYGAVALEDAPLSLILPLATIAAAVTRSG